MEVNAYEYEIEANSDKKHFLSTYSSLVYFQLLID